MVHTRLSRKFSVEHQIRGKSAHVGCHGLVALWGSLVGGLGATRSSPEQPRAAQSSPEQHQESQESSGALLGEPRVTQNTSTMTLFLATLVRRFSLANLVPQARGHPKSSKSAR